MEQVKNLAQGESIVIELARFRNGTVTAATTSATAAGFVGEVSVRTFKANTANNPTPIADEWVIIKLFSPVTKLDIANLTGPSISGWADIPGYDAVRIKRTDGTANDGTCGLTFREG